ncbi:Sec61beta family-domain-containing protein [Tricharina praecox]|uniref:Sec61beta family-domain-containing protein n=1 Tax=Tricharina praecox TaxID=43433 RepID=UPI00221FAE62|nr:Sec61beta family-domain-containing protein [Tricharina praecox]KAI5850697.1 Sec61beta family-domain-containing protein [Tricharina praecox]
MRLKEVVDVAFGFAEPRLTCGASNTTPEDKHLTLPPPLPPPYLFPTRHSFIDQFHNPFHAFSSTQTNKSTMSSSPRAASPANAGVASGSESRATGRPSSPTPPGGPKTAIRRRAAQDRAQKVANTRPSSTRAAGAGGSSSTMLKLYTDESPGLKVDPVIVLVLSLGFIFSVVALHVIAKLTRKFAA